MTRVRTSCAGAVILGLAWVGCGGGSASEPPSTAGSTGPASAPSAAYTLHEWGVVRSEPGDRLRVSAAPPPERGRFFFSPDAVVEKPVIYVHAEGEVAIRSIRVTADVGIVEHWPLTGASARAPSVTWQGLSAAPAHCVASRYPQSGEPPCDAIGDDDCEALSLASYEAASSSCLSLADGSHQNLLFYRSQTRVAPPLTAERDASGVAITTSVTLADTSIVWARMGRASVVTAPPAGARVLMPEPTEPADRAIATLSDEMARRGLTDDEVAAFWRAWRTTLTGEVQRSIDPMPRTGASTEDLVEETPVAMERTPLAEQPPPPAADVVFYFLPRESIDAIARLEADPPPREIVRVLGVIQAPR